MIARYRSSRSRAARPHAPSGAAFAWQALRDAADSATEIPFTTAPTTGIEKRLLSRSRTRYMADDLSGPLAQGSVESKALAYDSESMAMTDDQRDAVFGGLTGAPTNSELTTEGGYILPEDVWWVRTGHPTYDAAKFYAITAVTDPFGNVYTTAYDDHALLTVSASDPLGHTTTAEHDYRLLTPWQVTDANGNRTQVAFDILGFVTASAVMGKDGDSDGDTLEDPTSTFEYDLFAWQTTGKPNWAKSLVRETHQDPSTRWLEQRSYFSGAGAVVMVKAQARPGLAPQRDANGELILDEGELVLADTSPNLRWIGNGRTIKDNKGNVVKAYEPYFSSTPEYEDEAELVEQGVSPLMHYDPLGRLIRTDFPNGTLSRVAFTPWEQTTYDPNDTVLTSDWYAQRIDYAGSDVALLKEKRAAQQSAAHANTPSKVVLDSLGRPFLALAQLEVDVFLATKSVLDIQGRVLQVIDARGNTAESRTYGMLGQSLEVLSHDAGDRTNLLNALGQPMRSWDDRNQRHSVSYDTLRRPVDRTISVAGGAEKLLSRIVYGDDLVNPTTTNHAGRVYRCYDGAGVATTLAYDFKGHPVEEQRQLVAQKTAQADWSILFDEDTIAEMATAAASLLDAETFSASSERDALGRVLTAVSPDGSEVYYHYDEGGALQRVTLHHRGSATEQTPVGEITYDAKGRRESITHGPLASPTSTTNYTYDQTSQRLTRLRTVRASDDEAIQSLHYHYDAVGNITDIRDTAQQTVYFQNSVVEAANSYTYDGLYRLIEATGREHASEGTSQRTHADLTATAQPMTSDPSAMRRYTQQYVYDEVGNILEMRHIPATGTGWTRYYEYDEDGNRLLATSAPGDAPEGPYSHEYPYDAHGNMTAMPHLPSMVWNHDDELVSAVAGTETVYFQYAGGNRARKYTEKSGSTTEERIYLGSFEIYRKRVSGTIDVERESLHVSDDTGRILLIETKTIDAGTAVTTPTGIWRYQISNHLGSAATELTEDGDIISYEEYHPYGTTAYRAVDSSIDVSAKRYRYTEMERDEETGLAYHTARYYASWLGRWTASDSIGLGDGQNRYSYSGCRPVLLFDHAGTTGIVVVSEEMPSWEGSDEGGAWEAIGSGTDEYGHDATQWMWTPAISEMQMENKWDFLSRKSQKNAESKEAMQYKPDYAEPLIGATDRSFDQSMEFMEAVHDRRPVDAAASLAKAWGYYFLGGPEDLTLSIINVPTEILVAQDALSRAGAQDEGSTALWRGAGATFRAVLPVVLIGFIARGVRVPAKSSAAGVADDASIRTSWVERGAENDEFYFQLSREEQRLYMRGQKTFSNDFYTQHKETLDGFVKDKTGRDYVQGIVDRGRWLKENHPLRSSAVNVFDLVAGIRKTMATGRIPKRVAGYT